MTLDGTNSWAIDLGRGVLLVDPGPPDRGHVEAAIGREPLLGAFITHRHADHAAALELLPATTPIFAADPALARGTEPLRTGTVLPFGEADITVLTTAGHTDDSVSLLLDTSSGRSLVTGDTLLGGQHSTLVSRDTGDLGALLVSLDLLSTFAGVPGLPGHGEPIVDVGAHAASAVAHRRRRLQRLEAILTAHPKVDADELARSRFPHDRHRAHAAAWMIKVEMDYLCRSAEQRAAD